MPGHVYCSMIGNVVKEPQLRYTEQQVAQCDLRLAANRYWTAGDGTKREETCFMDVRAWSRTAERINKYVSKGDLMFVEGYLSYESWTKDAQPRSRHRLIVRHVQFLPTGAAAREPGEGE